ncbi:MAG: extracellular solute-binding protein [Phycisphaerales bacterium]
MKLDKLKWRINEVYQRRWLALPLSTRTTIAYSSCAVGLLMLAVAIYFMTRGGLGKTTVQENDVVLYSSADSGILEPLVAEFEGRTGVRVQVVGDTEATKTTGLVQRLISEQQRPRCDVWWSSEALGTMALDKAGVLEPFASASERDLPGGWPANLRAESRTWYGFALRARVIAYNTSAVGSGAAPKTLRELADPKWSNKVGMARPQFGTTRSHIAALIALHGPDPVREFLTLLKNNNVRLYDGNSSVVQALSTGEIHVGLTDTDDVWAGQANNWSVALNYEAADKPTAKVKGLRSLGAIVIPNTVARVRGGPNPTNAQKLADFLLSADSERMLAMSASKNVPVREALAAGFKQLAIPDPAPVTPKQIADAMITADAMIKEIFPLE